MDLTSGREIAETHIKDTRPVAVSLAAWIVGIGGVASIVIWPALAQHLMPRPFSAMKFLTILLAGIVSSAVGGFILQAALYRGRVWAWFIVVSVAALYVGVRVLMIVERVRGGIPLHDVLGADWAGTVMSGAAITVVVLLWLPSSWRWFTFAVRLRAMPADRLDEFLRRLFVS
jgi:hypothetical protein